MYVKSGKVSGPAKYLCREKDRVVESPSSAHVGGYLAKYIVIWSMGRSEEVGVKISYYIGRKR